MIYLQHGCFMPKQVASMLKPLCAKGEQMVEQRASSEGWNKQRVAVAVLQVLSCWSWVWCLEPEFKNILLMLFAAVTSTLSWYGTASTHRLHPLVDQLAVLLSHRLTQQAEWHTYERRTHDSVDPACT